MRAIMNNKYFYLLSLSCINIMMSAQVSLQSNIAETDTIQEGRLNVDDLTEIYSKRFSAVNPSLFYYSNNDTYINMPLKYNNGTNVIRPDEQRYPWESRLENGMPNVVVSEYGNLSIYLSSFVAFASTPPSKVGALAYTNNTNSFTNWNRPNAGLYWYNPNGVTADDKVVGYPGTGFLPTNIVATDIESMGIYDQYDVSKNGIKLIYLPQRESHNKIISAYLMNKSFSTNGILSGFENMKTDRISKQINFVFDFINGDTHMGILKVNDSYSFVSRVNAKRSYVKPDEQLPFKPDVRKRYRRETITPIGYNFVPEHVTLNVALDMSTPQWEPYSMQPFQMPGFENDLWYGLVTMFGTEGDSLVEAKQRTELAISNDGFHWRYLKPGSPFLDNGSNPNSDDYGCINIAIPVNNTHFSSDRNDLYYFYAASNKRHVSGRNPGISLAFGRRGAWAGLKGESVRSIIASPPVAQNAYPTFSLYDAFFLGSSCSPKILSSVTEDPTGKNINNMNSYVAVLMYALDGTKKGNILTAVLGAPKKGTTSPSQEYESVSFISGGKDATSKHYLLKYFTDQSRKNPDRIITLSKLSSIPVMFETWIKNGIFYGLRYDITKSEAKCALNIERSNLYQPNNIWTHSQNQPGAYYTENFSNAKLLPNEEIPINMTTGTIAIEATLANNHNEQFLFNIYGDSHNNNSMNIRVTSAGNIAYTLIKDGSPFASMEVSPPTGESFWGKKIHITVESLHPHNRKYGKEIGYDVTILRVYCPQINFEKIVPQPIIWNWKHAEGQITESDKANAQCFAFLEFTSFIPQMNKITVGSKNETGSMVFNGTINKIQFAPLLPDGASDFWAK